MADLGVVGLDTPADIDYGNDYSGKLYLFVSATALATLIPCAGGIGVAVQTARLTSGDLPEIIKPYRKQQLLGETQVEGVATAMSKSLMIGGRVMREYGSGSTDIYEDNLPPGSYELFLHGRGTHRSEVWGPTTIPAVEFFTLSGTLAACSSGVPYSSGFIVKGAISPIWDISGQALPTGLSFNTNTGVISGTTTEVGTTQHTIGVSLGDGARRKRDFVFIVS